LRSYYGIANLPEVIEKLLKEAVTCWIQKETHNRLKVFCALHRLSMMQVITQAVKERKTP
jgi:hypothetical protein